MSDTLVLARRIEHADALGAERSTAAYLKLYPERGAAGQWLAGGIAVFAAADSPLTRARGIGIQGPVSELELDELEAFYRSRGLPTRFELCPYADGGLIAAIGRRGYRLAGFVNVLVRDLDDTLPTAELPARQVEKADALAWSRLVAAGFNDAPSRAAIDVGLLLFERAEVACFVAEVDGVPAAGGAVWADAELAFLFAGSTLATQRGRGAQTALIAARLAWARAAGCSFVCVACSAGAPSQRNLERAGFRVIYTRASLMLP